MNRAQKSIKSILFHTLTKTRQTSYNLLSVIDRNLLKKKSTIVVFSYHSVAKDDWRFSVNPEVVKKQISYIEKNFSIITLETLQKYIDGKIQITTPSAVLTFDDGYKDILTLKDFFKKKNIKPALFVLANTKTPNWKELGTKRVFLTTKEIQSLHKAGWEIGLHSATHANLITLSEKELQNEIVDAKKTLEKTLGFALKVFAYPRGKYNATVESYVKKANFKMALTMDDGIIKPNMNALRIPRVGVDRTHSFDEFTSAFSPSVIAVRKAVKESPVGRYL